MKVSVQSLRASGYKVRVQHKRLFPGLSHDNIMTRGQFEGVITSLGYQPAEDGKYSKAVSPKGGETVVQITSPDGTELEGVAKCSLKDPYNRKRGLSIAIGRALNNGTDS